jgi:regulator of protease activity HflC (stomatin/prohibitin superfamily)
MQYAASLSVGDLLGGRRGEAQAELRKRIDADFAKMNVDPATGKPRGAGVKVLFVGIDGVHPPKETAIAFEQVVQAEQKYRAQLKSAEGRAIETLTRSVGSVDLATQIVAELDKLDALTSSGKATQAAVTEQQLKVKALIEKAGGTAATMIGEASAERWTRHMGERARLSAYRGQLETYRAAPSVYKAALYLDALRMAMRDARLYITDAASKVQIRFNLEDKDSITDILRNSDSPN